MQISSRCRTELAIAVNELTGQALLDRLEQIVIEASDLAYEHGLELDMEFDGD